MKKHSLFITILCLNLSTSILFADFNFFAISDLHLKADGSGGKFDQRNKIISLIKQSQINTPVVLLPGDMTDTGSDEEFNRYMNWFTPLNTVLKKFGGIKFNGSFRSGNVFACLGNHDHCSNNWYADSDIVKHIKTAYGSVNFYSFDVENLHFICCGMCPTDDGVSWLCKPDTLGQLADDLAANRNKKIVLFWHYNVRGPFSNWKNWGDLEKAKVLEILNPYSENILCIFNGHCHYPQFTTSWGPKQLPVALVGGSYFAVCKYRNQQDLNIYFMNAQGNKKTWAEMYRENP